MLRTAAFSWFAGTVVLLGTLQASSREPQKQSGATNAVHGDPFAYMLRPARLTCSRCEGIEQKLQIPNAWDGINHTE